VEETFRREVSGVRLGDSGAVAERVKRRFKVEKKDRTLIRPSRLLPRKCILDETFSCYPLSFENIQHNSRQGEK